MIRVERDGEVFEIRERIPLLPLRDIVIYPYMTIPLLVGRVASVNAIEQAVQKDRMVFVLAQKKPEVADPGSKDLYRVGTVVRVLQLFRLPDGTMRVLVEGICRGKVKKFFPSSEAMAASVTVIKDADPQSPEIEALQRNVLASFNDYVHLNRRVPDEVLATANNITNSTLLSYTVAAHLILKVPVKQAILEQDDLAQRFTQLSKTLASELEILKLERKIEGQVRSQVSKNQKEFYLNEQMKAIRKELGYQNEFSNEVDELVEQVKKAKMPKEVNDKAMKELDKLGKMSFMSPEATVVRNYIDWLVSLPWSVQTEDHADIKEVERILNEDHYGLKKVKERILEYLAVMKLSGTLKGPILCFVGPPGVGKTSLGKSIARSLGRKFVRMSLGGVRDEAEIRGHRRTYIGSMPGRIVQALKRAGSKNPVLLLDEIDKLGTDFRGDPASALLEVLDPEQNHTFNDHYLEVDLDLSQVMFLTTANTLYAIPPALQDRMEIVRLPGYLEFEKVAIARQFLLPKELKAHGLEPNDLKITDRALKAIIGQYTRESGVRSLEREIASICRKVAKRKAIAEAPRPVRLTERRVEQFLGAPKFLDSQIERRIRIGVATGLAWTEVGGDVLNVEVSVLPGSGVLVMTGKLGETMKESGQAALSYTRSRAEALGLDKKFYKEIDIHVHLPEGAIPKDGPSAGITIATALVSALTGVPTREDVAMTGEITLLGTVLPIGGLNEKVVAATRAGVKTIIIPKQNEKDLKELPETVRQGVTFRMVETMDEVLEIALKPGEPRPIVPAEPEGKPQPTAH
ncbi:MAG TPA: endopeptidase La [Candidatus Eisenbacteria bacterium]|nr:endopeptidase La [Candidatus Eisenbacteria bacterium]